MTTPPQASFVSLQSEQFRFSKGAWHEFSWVRVGSIALGTYIAATLLLWIIGVSNPYLGSLVPALGFLLSTQSLPAIKHWWIQRHL